MRRQILVILTLMLCTATACASATPPDPTGTPAPTPYPTPPGGLGHRPSTPVTITLISPTSGETVHGTSIVVKVSISGGTVTNAVGSDANPTLGHVHLYLNSQLIYMAYTLTQKVTVQPGLEYSMYAEFVAQDHYHFDPRDVTPTIFFTVAPA